MVGDFAEEIFHRLRCDTLVMGVGGIDFEAGCTEFSLEDAGVKRAALACVRRCIVVADSSKLGRVALAQSVPLNASMSCSRTARRLSGICLGSLKNKWRWWSSNEMYR